MELIRTHEFISRALAEHEDIARALAELDAEGAWACYDAYLNGDDWTQLLYPLLTFLSTSLTENLDEWEAARGTVSHIRPRVDTTPFRRKSALLPTSGKSRQRE